MKRVDFFGLLNNDSPNDPSGISRKDFLTLAGRGLAAGALGTSIASCSRTASTGASGTVATGTVGNTLAGGPVPKLPAQSPPATVPGDPQKPVELEQIKAKTEQQIPPGTR